MRLYFFFPEYVTIYEHSKHPSNNEKFNRELFEEHTTIERLPNLPNSALSRTSGNISYLHENFQPPTFIEQVELFSIQDVCQILTKQNQLSVTCEQSPSLIKFSAAKGL